jgi:GNAT superfamily N-acetyltransferase
MLPDQLNFQICKTDEDMKAAPEGISIVEAGLRDNFLKRLGHVEFTTPLNIFARDRENRIVGGLVGYTFCGWLFVDSFWVEEALRGKGVGKRLMSLAENNALQMGCKYAHLETFTFEARPFYEKLGYEVFGTLEDYPPGQTKYFLKKKLVP